MSGAIDLHEVRRKKLETLYAQYLSLLTYEGTLVSARFAHAIATQTIFFAAYFVVTTSVRLEPNIQYFVQLAVLSCAVISLLVYALILARTSVAATSWRASLTLIEEDEDFWYPATSRDFADLDIFGSRSRAIRGIQTRQQTTISAVTSNRFKIILFMGGRVRDPIDYYAIYFPVFFLVVWTALFVASTNHAVQPVANAPAAASAPAGSLHPPDAAQPQSPAAAPVAPDATTR